MLTIPKPKKTLDFQVEGSETVYSIPYVKDLPLDFVEDMTALADDRTGAAALAFLHRVMDRYAPGAWENINQEGLELILGEWAKALGEASPRR